MNRRLATSFLSAAAVSLGGCMFFHLQRDPNAAQVFPPTLSQLGSGVRTNESNIDGLDEEFQGSLAGATSKMKASSSFASLMGKYHAALKRYAADKKKWSELEAWANSVKSDPVQSDLDRLRGDGNAINMDLTNIGVTLRLLPGEVTRIQNQLAWQR
ncbi:MAG: hypothetical protein ACYDCL_15415 [Myxococcales bacterium]